MLQLLESGDVLGNKREAEWTSLCFDAQWKCSIKLVQKLKKKT